MNKTRVAVVIPARNEEKFIEKTLRSLVNQTLSPYQIVVVNDGSIDKTSSIASKYAKVVDLPDRGYRATGTAKLAEVVNKGLELIEETNYIMILGADHILPEEYLQIVTNRMEIERKIVVASGLIMGEESTETAPRGSGRVVQYNFWKNIGLRYPETLGWESYLVYKAMSLGYKAVCFDDIITHSQRPTGKRTNYREYGRAMHVLGYDWKYGFGRSFLTFLKNPRDGLAMLFGFLISKNAERLDVADWVNKHQKSIFWKKLYQIIFNKNDKQKSHT